MDMDNCPLVTYNWLSLRNNQLKFKTSRTLPIVLEESVVDTSN